MLNLPQLCLECTGVFTRRPVPTEGLRFAGDASGGPFTKDRRLRKVSYAVVAVKWDAEHTEWRCVGTIVANVDSHNQTVPYGEAAALRLCLQVTSGDVEFASDAQYVVRGARKVLARRPGSIMTHPDLWKDIADSSADRRLVVHKVKAHMSEKAFLLKYGADRLWAFHANQVADSLSTARASQLVHSGDRVVNDWVDGRVEKLLTFQVAVLEAVQSQLPKPPAKCPSTKPRRINLHRRLLGSRIGGHAWVSYKGGVTCSNCGLRLSRALTLPKASHLSEGSCLAWGDARALAEWHVHPSHDFVFDGRRWCCRRCRRRGPLNFSRRWCGLCKA